MKKCYLIDCTTFGRDIRSLTLDKVFSSKQKAEEYVSTITIQKTEIQPFFCKYTIKEVEFI